MKLFKRILTTTLALTLSLTAALSFTSCEKSGYTIGICQLVTHDALDDATEGFKQALIDELGEENVTFDYQNAANDTAACTTIANSFVSKNVDLIMANATPALQAAAAATTTIPILGTSITEYSVALSLDNFNGTVGGNISGTSDLAPLEEQAKMLMEFYPDAKNVGLLYCSGEANSAYQVQAVGEYLTAAGLTVEHYAFSDSNDATAVAEKACADSDVIYIPTDNTVASCAEIIQNVCLPAGVPVCGGDQGICGGCGTVTLAVTYYEIGYQTGLMAAQILRGEADISTMPIAYDPNPVKVYNPANCEVYGLTIPEDFVALEAAE